MNYNIIYKQILLIVSFLFFWTYAFAQENAIEEVFVTAEKRSESVQDISQAVTAISSDEIESKNITSFVDLSAIVPGVTVAKNEGYKTVISIRGVGNETNQNAIAAPSVAFHMDGIFIASPFSLQTDFIDVDRIEVLRGPQGTLFGQNSTGGVINVVSKKPSMEGYFGKSDITFGNYGLTKFRSSNNFVLSDSTAARFSISTTDRDGFSDNLVTGQDLDDDSNISLRADFLIDLGDNSSLRFFGQYFDVDRNGSAMKGIDDPTPNPRDLRQDSVSNHELTSSVFAAIYENDLGFANLKIMASVQEDDISVTRDNDRHNYGDLMITIPGFPADATYQRAEFRPETSLVDTTTFEINLVSNEPAMNGKLDWTIGAFYMEHEIENHIVGYLDDDRNGEIQYICGESYANSDYCYPLDSPLPWFFFEFDFVSDAYPTRESYSIYGETSYSLSDQVRFISGLRYIEDEVESCVKNFFTTVCDNLFGSSEETTGKVALEYDVDDDTMVYASFTSGSKPGGTNLTYGYTTQAELNAAFLFTSPLVDPLVFRTFEAEAVDSMEFGLKTDLYDGRARANIAIFSYDYENLQFQATDPDPYRGGVANIPESEMSGVEI